ncbi:MAG: MazG family protein [Gammaproteobacteria bacterium]|nr:MazG family protein [Gammaproteobacteria bacterium]
MRDSLRIQRDAVRVGFDWERTEDLWAKLEEEIGELRADAHDPARATDELGDLLFMAINLARHLKVDPIRALAGANRKFGRRFGHVLKHLDRLPPLGQPGRLDAMEAYWQEAKAKERRKAAARKRRGT